MRSFVFHRALPLLIALASLAAGACATPAGAKKKGDAGRDSASASGDFSLRDTKGRLHRLSDYSGKVVLLSFWATWCEPCQLELPKLQEIWDRNRDRGFVLLTVAVDSADQASAVKQLARRYRYRFPILLDQETEVADRYNPTMDLPFCLLLDRQGSISSRHQGYHPGDEKIIAEEVDALLSR